MHRDFVFHLLFFQSDFLLTIGFFSVLDLVPFSDHFSLIVLLHPAVVTLLLELHELLYRALIP